LSLPFIGRNVSNGGSMDYRYSAFVSLNDKEMEMLSDHLMTDIRLYIYDRTVDNSKKFSEYMKCIAAQ
jgi:hypothetical protein